MPKRILALVLLAGCCAIALAQSVPSLKPTSVLGRVAAGAADPADITLPEVMLFSACRQRELTGGGSEGVDQQIAQYRAMVHDGSRKVGNEWLGRPQQQRLRTEFDRRLAEAKKLLQQDKSAGSSTYSPAPSARPAPARPNHEPQAMQIEQQAALNWVDPALRELMLADLELRQKNYKAAETRLLHNVERDPFVAAYHQGRGLALVGLNQPLEALGEFTACLLLRDDSAAAYELVAKAMEAVPGAKVADPIYVRAKDLLDRYDAPKTSSLDAAKSPTAPAKPIDWLMPGKSWLAKDPTLFTPPVDRIVTKQALAIPISEDTLLTDQQAVDGAELIYVRLTPDMVVRAELVKPSTGASESRPAGQARLALLKVKGVTFTPVAVDKPPTLAVGQAVNLQAVNLYRQQGSEMREQAAKLAIADSATTLDKSLLPGEAMGVVTAGGQYAGLISGRTDVEDPVCGKAAFIAAADIAAVLPQARKSSFGSYSGSYSGYGSSGTLHAKKDAPPLKATGNIFVIETLTGEKPPTSLLSK